MFARHSLDKVLVYLARMKANALEAEFDMLVTEG